MKFSIDKNILLTKLQLLCFIFASVAVSGSSLSEYSLSPRNRGSSNYVSIHRRTAPKSVLQHLRDSILVYSRRQLLLHMKIKRSFASICWDRSRSDNTMSDGLLYVSNDFIFQQEPNRLIQFYIPDADSRNSLDIENPFEVGRYIWFKQTTGHQWFRAAIVSWNRTMQANDGVLWFTYQLNCYFHGDKSDIEN